MVRAKATGSTRPTGIAAVFIEDCVTRADTFRHPASHSFVHILPRRSKYYRDQKLTATAEIAPQLSFMINGALTSSAASSMVLVENDCVVPANFGAEDVNWLRLGGTPAAYDVTFAYEVSYTLGVGTNAWTEIGTVRATQRGMTWATTGGDPAFVGRGAAVRKRVKGNPTDGAGNTIATIDTTGSFFPTL